MEYGVISFSNTHSAMITNNYLKDKFKIIMMPTLREISTGCGISLRFDLYDQQKIQSAMLETGLSKNMYEMYRARTDDGKCVVDKIM